MWETAWAQEDGASQGDFLSSFLPLIFIVVIFYFLLIRPQQKRAKTHRSMLEALAVGDEIITAGGIYGTIKKMTDNVITLEVGKNEMLVQKQSIQSLVPTGSIEKL
ncbi:MAG: preprotein translocase subunit YajC [Gammaproteobacteria bacterium WSBS_2016_MAG_OTU1]